MRWGDDGILDKLFFLEAFQHLVKKILVLGCRLGAAVFAGTFDGLFGNGLGQGLQFCQFVEVAHGLSLLGCRCIGTANQIGFDAFHVADGIFRQLRQVLNQAANVG